MSEIKSLGQSRYSRADRNEPTEPSARHDEELAQQAEGLAALFDESSKPIEVEPEPAPCPELVALTEAIEGQSDGTHSR